MSFQVFIRLNKLGISTSHQTTLKAVKKLGINHDSDIVSRKEAATLEPDYILVGDNVDKNVSPRDMRLDNQVRSMHYFHSYAVLDRVSSNRFAGDGRVADINTLAPSAVLPTVDDCICMRTNYITLASRVIVENLSHFAFLQKCVVQHIPHQFAKESGKKSVIVSRNIHA